MSDVSQSLDLDITQALAAVDELEQATNAAVSGVGDELNDALRRVDASLLEEGILAAGEKSSAALRAEIEQALAKTEATIDINTNAEEAAREAGVYFANGKYQVALTVNNLDGTQKLIQRELSNVDVEAALRIDGTPLTAAAREAQRLGRYIEEADRASLVLPKGWREVDGQILKAGQQAQRMGQTIVRTKREFDLTGLSAAEAAEHVEQIAQETGQAVQQAQRLDREMQQASTSTGGMDKAVGRIKRSLVGLTAAFGVQQVAHFFSETIQSASDLAESQSKVNVVFGDGAEAITEWAKDSATALGLANQATLEYTGTFGNLLTSLGLARDAAQDLSPQIVQLGADLGSFNNIGTEEALEKLRAGLIGEAEPLRSVGVALTDVATRAKAVELGLAATTQEVSAAALVQARWAIILEQTSNAQGDFARTSEGLANQTKTMNAEFANAKVEIGQALAPAFLEIVRAARSDFIPALQEIAEDAGPAIVAAMKIMAESGGQVLDLMVTLTPVLDVFATVLSSIPNELLLVVTALVAMQRVMGPLRVLTGNAGLAGAMSNLGGAAAKVNLTMGAATLAATLWFDQLARGRAVQKEEKDRIESMTDSLVSQEKTVRDLVKARVEEFAKTDDGARAMREHNLGVEELTDNIIRFNGALTGTGDGAQYASRGLDFFNTGTRDSFQEINLAAKAALNAAVANKTLGQSTVDAAIAANTFSNSAGDVTDSEINYVRALEMAIPATEEQTAATSRGTIAAIEHAQAKERQTAAVDAAAAAMDAAGFTVTALERVEKATGRELDQLVRGFQDAAPSVEELADMAEYTGLKVEDLAEILAEAREPVDEFVGAAVEGADTIRGAFENLADDKSLDEFLTGVSRSVQQAATFYDNIATLAASGADDLARVLLEKGPEAARAAAEAVGLGPQQLLDRERALEESKRIAAENVAEAERLARDLFNVDLSIPPLAPPPVAPAGTLSTGDARERFDDAMYVAKVAMEQGAPARDAIALGFGEEFGAKIIDGIASGLANTGMTPMMVDDRLTSELEFFVRDWGLRSGEAFTEGFSTTAGDVTPIDDAIYVVREAMRKGMEPVQALALGFGRATASDLTNGFTEELTKANLDDALYVMQAAIDNGATPTQAKALAFGTGTAQNITSGFTDGMDTEVIEGGVTLFGDVVDTGVRKVADDVYDEAFKVGENLARGMADGASDLAERENARQAAAYTARAMAEAAAAELQEESPSKVGYQIGAYFVQGVTLGVESQQGYAEAAATAVGLGLTDAFWAGVAVEPEEELAVIKAVQNLQDAEKKLGEARGGGKQNTEGIRSAERALADAREAQAALAYDALATDRERADAARAVADAQRDLTEARKTDVVTAEDLRAAELEVAIAQRELNDAVADAIDPAKKLAEAYDEMTGALNDTIGAYSALRDLQQTGDDFAQLQADANKATADLERFDARIAEVTKTLEDARKARIASGETEPSVDERRAQATLRDLERRRPEVAKDAREANAALTDALIETVEATARLVESASEAGPAIGMWDTYLRNLGEAAGLTTEQINGLIDSLNVAVYTALATRNSLFAANPYVVPNIQTTATVPPAAPSTKSALPEAQTAGVHIDQVGPFYETTDARTTAREAIDEMKVRQLLGAG